MPHGKGASCSQATDHTISRRGGHLFCRPSLAHDAMPCMGTDSSVAGSPVAAVRTAAAIDRAQGLASPPNISAASRRRMPLLLAVSSSVTVVEGHGRELSSCVVGGGRPKVHGPPDGGGRGSQGRAVNFGSCDCAFQLGEVVLVAAVSAHLQGVEMAADGRILRTSVRCIALGDARTFPMDWKAVRDGNGELLWEVRRVAITFLPERPMEAHRYLCARVMSKASAFWQTDDDDECKVQPSRLSCSRHASADEVEARDESQFSSLVLLVLLVACSDSFVRRGRRGGALAEGVGGALRAGVPRFGARRLGGRFGVREPLWLLVSARLAWAVLSR